MIQVVSHPGRKQLVQGDTSEPGVDSSFAEVVIGDPKLRKCCKVGTPEVCELFDKVGYFKRVAHTVPTLDVEGPKRTILSRFQDLPDPWHPVHLLTVNKVPKHLPWA